MTTEAERLAAVERDVLDHARIITEMTTGIGQIRGLVSDLDKREALRSAEEKHVDERFDRIDDDQYAHPDPKVKPRKKRPTIFDGFRQ